MRPLKYSPETLQKALDEVKTGALTAYAAHKKYDIPKSTLSDKLKGIHSQALGNETAEREKAMREVREELSLETERMKSTRERLKLLEAEAATERKKTIAKRKLQNETKKAKTKQLVVPDTKISRAPKKRIRLA